jgi:hypothetical protein
MKSNMAVEEKRLNLEILEERIKLERVKADTVRAKAAADNEASRIKSANNKIDLISTIVKVGSKLL